MKDRPRSVRFKRMPHDDQSGAVSVDALALLLFDVDAEVRSQAAADLSEFGIRGIPALRPLVFVALNDQSEVRNTAAASACAVAESIGPAFSRARDRFCIALKRLSSFPPDAATCESIWTACDELIGEINAVRFPVARRSAQPSETPSITASPRTPVKEDVMDDLVLDQSQVRVVLESDRPVAVRDEEGREIGVLIPHGSPADREAHLVPEVAAELVRRMSMDDIRWSTTQEVLSRLGNRDAS